MPIAIPMREIKVTVPGPARPALHAAASSEVREMIARAAARAGL